MPTTPQRSPPSTMAKSTHSAETPMDLPRILGPMMLPSTCWMMRMRTRNLTASMGLTKSRMMIQGTAPMKGPNTGMMLVMPTTTAMSGAKLMFSSEQHTKVSTPMMPESIILPMKNPSKFSLARVKVSRTTWATGRGRMARARMRSWRSSLSFSASI